MENWQIRPSTFFVLAFVATLLLIPLPFGIELLIPLVSIPIYLALKKQGYIREFEFIDVPLIFIYSLAVIFGSIYLGMISLISIPWWQILVVGIAADVVASVLGTIPIIGDGVSSIVNMIIALTVIGGLEGAVVGMVIMMISLLPGPSLGANTFFLIIFKLISKLTIGG